MPTHPASAAIDLDALRAVLDRYPIRVAVLFGSAVSGRTHADSDVDIAIEFEPSVSDPASYVLALIVDIESAIDRNDVDLAVVRDLKPRVGLNAFTEGTLLVGTQDRKSELRDRFDREVDELERTEPSLGERFDAVVSGIDAALADGP